MEEPVRECSECGAHLSSEARFCADCAASRGERGTEVDPEGSGATAASPTVHDARIGTMLAGYRIEGLIARGGMGVVYRAAQLQLDRLVALKLLAPELAGDRRFRERFIAESRSAAAIDHPNILPVFEAGAVDGQLFIATRLVDGPDLKSLIRSQGRLDLSQALSFLGQVGAALDAAHAVGLVHRDVKPANVLIDRSRPGEREHCYLTDFGLTKRAQSESGYTGTGQFVGTTDYVAPEQIQGRPLDGRTDLYALGCMLYECLTGEVPFPRDSEVAVLWAHVNEPPPKVTRLRSELPVRLDDILEMAMAKAPGERFASCRALVAATRAAVEASAPGLARLPQIEVPAAPPPLPKAPRVADERPPRELPRTRPRPQPPRDIELGHAGRGAPVSTPASGPSRRRGWVALAAIGASLLVAGGVVTGALLLRGAGESEREREARGALDRADESRSLRDSVGDLTQQLTDRAGEDRPEPALARRLRARGARALVIAQQARRRARQTDGRLNRAFVALDKANRRLHEVTTALVAVAENPSADSSSDRLQSVEDDTDQVDDNLRDTYLTLGPALPPEERDRARNGAASIPDAAGKPQSNSLPARRIVMSPDGTPQDIGGLDATAEQVTVADAEAAFGPSESAEGESDACLFLWKDREFEVRSLNLGISSGGCPADEQFVQDILIRSEQFETEAGLRVGMTEEELLKRHPRASTKGGDPFRIPDADEADALYTIETTESPIAQSGSMTSLGALMKEGRVVALEVTPFKGGE